MAFVGEIDKLPDFISKKRLISIKRGLHWGLPKKLVKKGIAKSVKKGRIQKSVDASITIWCFPLIEGIARTEKKISHFQKKVKKGCF